MLDLSILVVSHTPALTNSFHAQLPSCNFCLAVLQKDPASEGYSNLLRTSAARFMYWHVEYATVEHTISAPWIPASSGDRQADPPRRRCCKSYKQYHTSLLAAEPTSPGKDRGLPQQTQRSRYERCRDDLASCIASFNSESARML